MSCGHGKEYRTRSRSIRAEHGGADCQGSLYQVGANVNIKLIVSRDCLSSSRVQCSSVCCPRQCEWSSWSQAACSVPCGGGVRRETRQVRSEAECGGACDGDDERTVTCNTDPCPQECSWGDWQPWQEWSIILAREVNSSYHSGQHSRF